jgi:hypothetical protein
MAPNTGVVSVKDPQFGVIGDVRTDDTKAFQAAADYCYGFGVRPTGLQR